MSPEDASDAESERGLRAIALRWIETGWQRPDLAAFRELHAPGFVDHSAAGRAPTLDGFVAGVVDLYAAFPDFCAEARDLIGDPARGAIAIRWTATGTHRGAFMGVAASHRQVSFDGIEIIRVSRGRIRERWGEWNGLGILEQIRGRK